MRKYYIKKYLSGILIIAGLSCANAQYTRATWTVGLGFNVTADARAGQLFNPSDNWNIVPYPSRIWGERYIKNGFSFELAASMNNLASNKYFEGALSTEARTYFAVDADFKYYINELYGNSGGHFDPYLLWGYGLGYISPNDGVLQPAGYPTATTGGMYNLGIGCNGWINSSFGINLQIESKWAFRNQLSSDVQYALGVVYRFGGNNSGSSPDAGPSASPGYNVLNHLQSQFIHTAWIAGVGSNIVADPGSQFSGLFDAKNNWNWAGTPLRLSIERLFLHGFGLELAGALNKYEVGKIENGDAVLGELNYFSVDMNVNYHFRVLFKKEMDWFDPYVLGGYGYTQIQPLNGWTHNLGLGFNFWINDVLGINLQSMAKWGYINGVSNTLQHSAGIVYKFGQNDTSKKAGEASIL